MNFKGAQFNGSENAIQVLIYSSKKRIQAKKLYDVSAKISWE